MKTYQSTQTLKFKTVKNHHTTQIKKSKIMKTNQQSPNLKPTTMNIHKSKQTLKSTTMKAHQSVQTLDFSNMKPSQSTQTLNSKTMKTNQQSPNLKLTTMNTHQSRQTLKSETMKTHQQPSNPNLTPMKPNPKTDIKPLTGGNLSYPEPISPERISYLIRRGIDPVIARIDLEMVKMKLREPDEGENWTAEQCESAELEYKRYLHLCKVFGKGMVPNKIMDTFWHYHILDTRAYHRDCEMIFGNYLHHYPYFGMRGEEDATNLKLSFLITKQLYYETFGEEMARDEHTDCWHDCENRCWHACADED